MEEEEGSENSSTLLLLPPQKELLFLIPSPLVFLSLPFFPKKKRVITRTNLVQLRKLMVPLFICFVFSAEKSAIWSECSPALRITNKSYTLSYPPSATTSSTSSTPPFLLGAISKPFWAQLIERYFEIVVDSLPFGFVISPHFSLFPLLLCLLPPFFVR
jgi:hypothetical protein